MPEENMNQEFRLQKIDEIRKYLIIKIKNIEDKTPDITNVTTKTILNLKIMR